jgi:hypothetical protein
VAREPTRRWANVAAGIVFTLAMAAILLAPIGRGRMPDLDCHSFFALVEILATVTIVWRAWCWKADADF